MMKKINGYILATISCCSVIAVQPDDNKWKQVHNRCTKIEKTISDFKETGEIFHRDINDRIEQLHKRYEIMEPIVRKEYKDLHEQLDSIAEQLVKIENAESELKKRCDENITEERLAKEVSVLYSMFDGLKYGLGKVSKETERIGQLAVENNKSGTTVNLVDVKSLQDQVKFLTQELDRLKAPLIDWSRVPTKTLAGVVAVGAGVVGYCGFVVPFAREYIARNADTRLALIARSVLTPVTAAAALKDGVKKRIEKKRWFNTFFAQ